MSTACPTAEQIQAFVISGADTPENEALIEHLETCAICQVLMDRFSPTHSMPTSVASSEKPVGGGGEANPELARAILRSVREALGADESGEDVGARFRLVRLVGSGGMGDVYEALDTQLGRRVALKTIRAGSFSPEVLARLKAEARALAELEDPGIVRVYAWGTRRGLPYLAMEYVDGETLGTWLERGRLAPNAAAGLMARVARAMDHAHRSGLVHRDLKPSNILMVRPGLAGGGTAVDGELSGWQPKVIDFGLSKRLDDAAQMTHTGTLLGTPAYMAPEQAGEGVQPAGPRSDLYSLGAVLYQCLTGQPPFPSASVANTLQMIRNVEPPSPRLFDRRIPRDLETVCLKCLRKEPGGRYATAGDLADDLERFLAGRAVVARPAGRVEKLWRWAGRNRKLAAALAALMVVLTLLPVVLGVYAWREARLLGLAEAETARANALVEKGLEGFKTAAHGLVETAFHLRRAVATGEMKEEAALKVRRDLLANLLRLIEGYRRNKELAERHPDWLVELLFAQTILSKDAEDFARQYEAEEQVLEIIAGMRNVPRALGNMELELALIVGDRRQAEGKTDEALALWQGVWSRRLNSPADSFPFLRGTPAMMGHLKDRLLCAIQAGGNDPQRTDALLLQWQELKERVGGAFEK